MPKIKPFKPKIKPFKGSVKIGEHSSLRKLARAMRRGKVPDDRQVIIDTAMDKASHETQLYRRWR